MDLANEIDYPPVVFQQVGARAWQTAAQQRTSEIGIRVALGAQRSEVAWLFLRRTLPQVGGGIAIGVAGAFGVGQVLRGLLVGASTTDPLGLAGIIALLLLVAAVACFFPTRRALRLDPVTALRHE